MISLIGVDDMGYIYVVINHELYFVRPHKGTLCKTSDYETWDEVVKYGNGRLLEIDTDW